MQCSQVSTVCSYTLLFWYALSDLPGTVDQFWVFHLKVHINYESHPWLTLAEVKTEPIYILKVPHLKILPYKVAMSELEWVYSV